MKSLLLQEGQVKFNREKFLTFLPFLIIFIIALIAIFPTSNNSNDTSIDNKENNYDDEKNIYVCSERNLEMTCDSLSKVNNKNTQTRCYFYDERLTYKICSKGWRLKE